MPITINARASNGRLQEEIAASFLTGVNSFQDETLIKPSDLTKGVNIVLDADGIIPRPGTSHYEQPADSTVLGAIGFYRSNGTRELLRMSGGHLKKYVNGVPTQIGSATYSTTADTNFVQARDKVYIFNGVQALSYYDGNTITTYTALTTPTGLTVTPQGTPGTTTYSYRINAFNAVGETLASTAVTTNTGNATLSNTNYNKLDWTAVSGAQGYNIWGRTATGIGETYLDTVYTNQYLDKGQRTPSLVLLPPEANTTAGVKASMAIYALSRLFAAGDPDKPSRLYYSGYGENLGKFNTEAVSGSEVGGGYVDIFPNDGAIIRDIKPFQGGVIVWKDNAIYKLSFVAVTVDGTTISAPQLEEITRSFGGISFRSSMAVENDIVFAAKKDGRLAFYSLGNQENYAGSVVRTNELSVKISQDLKDVKISRLPNTAAHYFNSLYACAVTSSSGTKNDTIWVLDTRFGSWYKWTNIPARCFTTWEDADGNVELLAGMEETGYLERLYQKDRNDNDLPIPVEFALKSFNQKRPNKIKAYYHPTFQFKDINTSGAIKGYIYIDGVEFAGEFTISAQSAGGSGLGFDLFGEVLFGDAGGETTTDEEFSRDTLQEVWMVKEGRAIKFSFSSNTKNLYYKFLSVSYKYRIKEAKRLPSTRRTYLD